MTDYGDQTPHHDNTRPDATGPDYEYSLTMEEVAERYAENNLPRTLRTIQRYCAKGHLDARKVATTFGDKYLVAPYSVSRHIAQIQETIAFTQSLGNRDTSRQNATMHDTPRHVATGQDKPGDVDAATPREDAADARYVKQLESEVSFLRGQVAVKDSQIGELTERAKETNFLIQGLQKLVLALQPARPDVAPEQPAAPQGNSVRHIKVDEIKS